MATGAFALGFAGWCPHSITLEPWDGTFDVEGKPQHGAPVTLDCRIEEQIRVVRDLQGNERVSTTRLFVLGGPISPHDLITMPVTYKGQSQPPIITVSNIDGATSFDHAEVYV